MTIIIWQNIAAPRDSDHSARLIGIVERPTRLRRYGTLGPLASLVDEITDRALMAVAKRPAGKV